MSKQVSFKFDEQQTEALDNIKTTLHASTQAEAIRKSLNLTSALASAKKNGYTILIRKGDEEQELLIV